jgi:hypothetical protein
MISFNAKLFMSSMTMTLLWRCCRRERHFTECSRCIQTCPISPPSAANFFVATYVPIVDHAGHPAPNELFDAKAASKEEEETKRDPEEDWRPAGRPISTAPHRWFLVFTVTTFAENFDLLLLLAAGTHTLVASVTAKQTTYRRKK